MILMNIVNINEHYEDDGYEDYEHGYEHYEDYDYEDYEHGYEHLSLI